MRGKNNDNYFLYVKTQNWQIWETDSLNPHERVKKSGFLRHVFSASIRLYRQRLRSCHDQKADPSKFTLGPSLSRPLSSHVSLFFLPVLSGFSAPLTTLSRKFVNVHACPIIRSLSTFVFAPSSSFFFFFLFRSRFLDRSLSPLVPCFSSTAESREIETGSRARVTNSRRAVRALSRASRKRSIAARCASPPWSRRKEKKRGEATRGSGIVSPPFH